MLQALARMERAMIPSDTMAQHSKEGKGKGKGKGKKDKAPAFNAKELLNEEQQRLVRRLPTLAVGQWQRYIPEAAEKTPDGPLNSRSIPALRTGTAQGGAGQRERRRSSLAALPNEARGKGKEQPRTIVRQTNEGGYFGGGKKEKYAQLAEKILNQMEVSTGPKKAARRKQDSLALNVLLQGMKRGTKDWDEASWGQSSERQMPAKKQQQQLTFGPYVSTCVMIERGSGTLETALGF